jgi:hypothetical protein
VSRLRTRLPAAFAAVLAMVIGTPAYAAPTPAPARAMWLWDAAPPQQVVGWATANDVKTIFVNFTRAGDLPYLRQLKQRANAAGIRLDALGGDPGWVFDRAAALAWSRAADATGLFSGRHVDTEPYLLPEWTTNREATARAYLNLLDALRTASRSPLEIDVPFWYGQFSVRNANLADEVVRRVPALTVMSYRDRATGPNSILDVGADMLVRAGRRGVRTRLAVETQPLTECGYCTFARDGRSALTSALHEADVAAVRYPAYGGMAVHHFASWSRLS